MSIGQLPPTVQVGRCVATGGMGRVHEGTAGGLPAAFKFPIAERGETGRSAASQIRVECSTLQRLSSPHIPRLLGHGDCEDGAPYIAIDWITGDTLNAVLAKQGPVGAGRACTLFRQVLTAVESCHHAGVIHADIKPENIMVQRVGAREHVYLIDFGISERVASTGMVGFQKLIYCTPGCVAPEVLSGGEHTVQSDIYSLGVVLFQMITGKRPFIGAVPEILRDQNAGLPCAGGRSSQYPRWLNDVLHTALNPNPMLRFRSVSEMRSALCSPRLSRFIDAIRPNKLRGAARTKRGYGYSLDTAATTFMARSLCRSELSPA